jgi:putative SOS response-associated peptidase YedK
MNRPGATAHLVRSLRPGFRALEVGQHIVEAPARRPSPVPKAMPVILRSRQEIDLWMTAPSPEALTLQRTLPNGALVIVARSEKRDTAAIMV